MINCRMCQSKDLHEFLNLSKKKRDSPSTPGSQIPSTHASLQARVARDGITADDSQVSRDKRGSRLVLGLSHFSHPFLLFCSVVGDSRGQDQPDFCQTRSGPASSSRQSRGLCQGVSPALPRSGSRGKNDSKRV